MIRTVYVNGAYVPENEAKISIFDRGFIFADGVYEVAAVLDGKPLDSARHKWRLEQSLEKLSIPMPMPWDEIEAMQRKLVHLNKIDQGMVYYQVTRGAADREFWYEEDMTPSLVGFTQQKQLDPSPLAENGVSVVTCPDLRWQRRDIKSVSLLAQVMAKQIAHEMGATEALMTEDGFITEGSSSSAFIVDQDGNLIVRPGGGTDILPGLTRQVMLELARETGARIIERPFTVEDLYKAREAFLTAATIFVMPITRADDRPIGDGVPGPLTRRLREIYIQTARATAT